MALGQPGQLVVAADHDRRAQVAGRDAVHGGRDRPQRGGQVGGEGEGHEHREQRGDGDAEEQDARHRFGWVRRELLRGDDDQAERGQREDRRGDQGDGQPGPKADPRVERLGGGRRASRRVGHGVGSDLRSRPEPAGRDRLAGRGAGLGRPRQRAGRRRSIRAGWPVGHAQVLVPASGWLPSRESGSSMATSR